MSWQKVKEQALIKCKRYCCLCGQFKGVGIEVHHIIQRSEGGEDTLDNAIPLCFDCHCLIGNYNPKHPKGNRYTPSELRYYRDALYEKVKDMPVNFQDTQGFNSNTGVDNLTVGLWRKLNSDIENYQKIIDYAYGCWKGNFKDKYSGIHNPNSLDYYALQDEIDLYGDNLYKDIFTNINSNYNEAMDALEKSIAGLSLELSKELYDKLNKYISYMSFHYQSDGGVGIVNYYWSSFFKCLDKNYDYIRILRNEIDEMVRAEYRGISANHF